MDLTEPVLLTPEGLEKLKRDLDVTLKRRAEAGERLKEAFQPGDIEDNPEYEQAKEEVGLLDSRIYELQEMIGRAEIIKESHSSVAGPGSTIDVVENDGATETYHLVGAVESDPSAGRISVDSPVGRALVGKKKGDKVTVNVPQGSLTLTIKSVH
jgi:transcription elongation factor GreA